MLVCAEWTLSASSRVAPQVEFIDLSQQNTGTGFLFAGISPVPTSWNEHQKEDKTMSATTKIPYKIYLEESEMPSSWYNLRADMINKPAPLLNPGTLEPMKAEELAPVF